MRCWSTKPRQFPKYKEIHSIFIAMKNQWLGLLSDLLYLMEIWFMNPWKYPMNNIVEWWKQLHCSAYNSTGYGIEILNEMNGIPGPRCIDIVDISPNDVNDSIDDLSGGASPRPDGKPALVLKLCKNSLKTPIWILWRNSMLSVCNSTGTKVREC